MDTRELFEHGFLLEKAEGPGEVNYFIIQPDMNGKISAYSITKNLYDFYTEEKHISKRLSNWDDNHRDMRDLEVVLETDDYVRAVERMNSEQYARETLDVVVLILKTCTPIEQKRFILKFVEGYSYAEIARCYHVSEASVKESVYKVLKKMNKL